MTTTTQKNKDNPVCSPLPWNTNVIEIWTASCEVPVKHAKIAKMEMLNGWATSKPSGQIEGDSRLIVAAVNAIHQLAEREGLNPVLLAEYLANGGLLAMFNDLKAVEKTIVHVTRARFTLHAIAATKG